ncbi:MAG: hypothetical protein IT384_07860 [Deltaproteobacteria bacterium]|nr:hypothetical protein [Deltaproteobacteria bacterium]
MRWIGAAAVVLLVLSAASSFAKCRAPSPILTPAPGSELPPDPVLWFFARPQVKAPPLRARDANGHAIAIEITDLKEESAPAFRVMRLRLRTGAQAEGKIVVEYVEPWSDEWKRAEYTIVNRPASPAAGVEILRQSERQYAWTCSYQSTVDLSVSIVAPSYRVEWSSTLEDYRAGLRRAVVLPGDLSRLFGGSSEDPSTISLGHVDCTGTTLEWKDPAIFVGVSALFSDGTATPMPASPTRLERPDRANLRRE